MKKIILLAAALALVAITGCKKSSVDIKGVSDLAGKKIGVQTLPVRKSVFRLELQVNFLFRKK